MATRRTTVDAERESLATLEAEAKRRGVPLATVLVEAIDEKAAAIRQMRSPRVGIGRSADGRAATDVASEPIARTGR